MNRADRSGGSPTADPQGVETSQRRGDRGGGTLVMMMVSAAALALVLGALGPFGAVLIARQQAQNAADAVALAAVIGGPAAASRIAARHDVIVVRLDLSGDQALVQVRRGQVVAAARATKAP